MRFKITDTIGAVAFVDAGSVTDESYPGFDNLAVGAGVGLRYYTGFGPIRFDVATPLSGDENTSQNFQVYISIGQAF
jgi:translocation and assembly module TamA